MPQPRVMIVEDDEELNDVLQYNLAREGFQPIPILDGEQACQEMRAHAPELVLLDLMLPGREGWDVLKYMAGEADLRDIPVIIFTARSAREDFDRARGYGNFAGYFVKPYATGDVLRHVRKVLQDRPRRSVSPG